MATVFSFIALYAVLNAMWMYLFKLGPFTPHLEPFMMKLDGTSMILVGLFLAIGSLQLLLKLKPELTTKEIIWNLYKGVLAIYLLVVGHHFVSDGWSTLLTWYYSGSEKPWWSIPN